MDLLHSALDSLPSASVSGSYHLSVIWLLKDHLPDECRTSRPLFSLLARARHWHGANIVAVPLKSYQNLSETNNLLNSVRVESLVAGDIECLPEFLSKNVLWRGRKSDFFPGIFIFSFLMFVFFSPGSLAFIDPKTYLPKPMEGFELYAKEDSTLAALFSGLPGGPDMGSAGPKASPGTRLAKRTRFSR